MEERLFKGRVPSCRNGARFSKLLFRQFPPKTKCHPMEETQSGLKAIQERARRVIFFGRYQASQFGSPYIETEHLGLRCVL